MNVSPRLACSAILIVASLAFGRAMGATAAEREAMAATQAGCDAIRRRDVAALERLLAPEFVLVSSSSQVHSREDVLREVRAGDPQYERFENHDMTARIYGDTAVVQGITSLQGRSGGAPFALDVRFTDTLVRVDGRWTMVVSHVTRIPDSAPAPAGS